VYGGQGFGSYGAHQHGIVSDGHGHIPSVILPGLITDERRRKRRREEKDVK